MLSALLLFQVDLGSINSNDGHIGYFLQLYDNFVPYQSDPRDKWQFYHPPLHHYIEAAPLSLSWSLRNLIRFGVPIGYIPLSLEPLDRIKVPLMQRLFDFNPNLLDMPNVVSRSDGYSYNEYNPLVALIKVLPYGFKVDAGAGFLLLFTIEMLLWTTIILCTVSLICMIYVLVKKNTLSPINKVMLLGTYLTVLISYYVFCIKYADVCTENIRYATPLVFLGAVFIGLTLKQLKEHNGKICKLLHTGITTLVIIFCITSFIMFAHISFNWSAI